MDIQEDILRYPYYIFVNIQDIPWKERLVIQGSLCNSLYTHCMGLSNMYTYLNKIRTLRRKQIMGILPPNIISCVNTFYYYNQNRRWAFKKLLYAYNVKRKQRCIYNTECLDGTSIETLKNHTSRRWLYLWDFRSNKCYIYRLDEILGILRASILGDEIHSPKNPYTNLRFTFSQLRVIYLFLHNNMDRVLPYDLPILTYLRWNSKEITYNHLNLIHQNVPTMVYSPMSVTMKLLWDNAIHIETLFDDKKQLAEDIRNEFVKIIQYHEHTNFWPNPTTKIEYFVLTKLCNEVDDGLTVGDRLKHWFECNRRRYMIRRNPPLSE